MKITYDYAIEMAKYLCTQLEVEKAHPANLSPEGKEFYPNVLTTDDSTFETYLAEKISDFIEGL